jgi:alkanesulfonate monooxygenase SsuD/methylene tetrahydromethanopterin reductase-like flavin-dependent oxidoreductase (luciferase family)
MAVAADRTARIRIGPMVTPLARRRPQVLARQVLALDQLSGGRFILGAGLGLDTSGGELSKFGEEMDDRRRAAMLDEGLEVLTALLCGEEVHHRGPHYTVDGTRFLPRRADGTVPIWLAARWPYRRPLRRAAGYDGVFVIDLDSPANLADALATISEHRPGGLAGYDVAIQADPSGDPGPWAEAGATWWLAGFDPFTTGPEQVRSVIAAGPPTLPW